MFGVLTNHKEVDIVSFINFYADFIGTDSLFCEIELIHINIT